MERIQVGGDAVTLIRRVGKLKYRPEGDEKAPVASLSSIVGFKRLAGRPRDRRDLEELEAFHGELPSEPIPGVDT